MLPREVISMTPLPYVRAAVHKAANASQDIVAPVGVSRTSRPSPVAMGCERPGQMPRRRGALTAPPLSRAFASLRRRRCAEDAKARDAEPRRDGPRWWQLLRDSPAEGSYERRRPRHTHRAGG